MLRRTAAIVRVAAIVLAAGPALAQAPIPVQAPPPATRSEIPEEEKRRIREEIRAELEGELELRLDAAKEEMRDEIRAAMITAGASSSWDDGWGDSWDDEWESVQPKLDLFEVGGYFRTRMDLFYRFDLRTGEDPSGHHLFPVDPQDPDRSTIAGANMRLRIDPTLNVSEEVRIRGQVDVFDNLLYGSTPRGGFAFGQGNQRYPWVFLSRAQERPEFGWNAITDSIAVKRAWAEVRTPVGELRFGRMADNFGLGMNVNDGNCLDCDNGNTVDRFLFAVKIADHLIAPALDFTSEGPTSANPYTFYPNPQPFDRSQVDDARAWVLTIQRKDSYEEIQRMRAAGRETFFNYGLHFAYRTQSFDAQTLNVPEFEDADGRINRGGNAGGGAPQDGVGNVERASFVPREAWAVVPDVWMRLLHKNYRLELEFVTVQGRIRNRPSLWSDDEGRSGQDVELSLSQYGLVVQNELKLANDKLSLGLEFGFASGDKAPGFGAFPGRADRGSTSDQPPYPQRGDWEGAQFNCFRVPCSDNKITNFVFNSDYRMDLILFREIIGAVTDASYIRPSVRYDVLDGLDLNLAVIYSQVNASGTTPTGDRPLGIEIDAAVNYISADGFIASLAYGVLFPLSGLDQLAAVSDGRISASTAQAIRGFFGIVY